VYRIPIKLLLDDKTIFGIHQFHQTPKTTVDAGNHTNGDLFAHKKAYSMTRMEYFECSDHVMQSEMYQSAVAYLFNHRIIH